MIAFRYFTPIIPLLFIFTAPASLFIYTDMFKDTSKNIKNIIFSVIIILVLLSLALTISNNLFTLKETVKSDNLYRSYSLKLKEYMQPDEYFFYYDVGAIPYYSGFNVIDPVGLVDSYIAGRPGCLVNSKEEFIGNKFSYLSKFDSDYVLDRKPKIILITSTNNKTIVDESSTLVISQQLLTSNPRFYKEYSIKSIDNFGSKYILVFMRN